MFRMQRRHNHNPGAISNDDIPGRDEHSAALNWNANDAGRFFYCAARVDAASKDRETDLFDFLNIATPTVDDNSGDSFGFARERHNVAKHPASVYPPALTTSTDPGAAVSMA